MNRLHEDSALTFSFCVGLLCLACVSGPYGAVTVASTHVESHISARDGYSAAAGALYHEMRAFAGGGKECIQYYLEVEAFDPNLFDDIGPIKGVGIGLVSVAPFEPGKPSLESCDGGGGEFGGSFADLYTSEGPVSLDPRGVSILAVEADPSSGTIRIDLHAELYSSRRFKFDLDTTRFEGSRWADFDGQVVFDARIHARIARF